MYTDYKQMQIEFADLC